MAGEMKLPLIGKVKTTYAVAGIGLTLGIVGYAYYKHRQSAGSSSATTAAATTAATAAIDPQTGYPQGSPEDLAALQSLDGTSGYGLGTSGYGLGGAEGLGGYGGYGGGYGGQQMYYDPADGLYDLTSPYTGSSTGTGTSTANTGPGTFTDNAYWVQYAIEQVQGYSASQIQGALATYLAGQGLTTTQMSIYQSALAVAGPPPSPPSQPAHLVTTTPPKPDKIVIANGKSDLNDIARDAGTNEPHVVALNPELAHYVGTKKDIPAGTKVKV